MRLWSLHPEHLDRQGLLALWREGLLAQKVIAGRTRGYRAHPQLERFRDAPDPAAAIAGYLRAVREEAERRGYRFDGSKVPALPDAAPIEVTDGQMAFERRHLSAKLAVRDPVRAAAFDAADECRPHPLFRVVVGPIAPWERPRG